jgi:ring-1,2-phenylacetyl-CoA epoxidase subunit PaaC
VEVPDVPAAPGGGRQGKHSEHLGYILAEMQVLAREYPGASW